MTLAPPQRLHHVAYLTRDTQKTVDFYTRCLNMKPVASVQSESVPSTGDEHPHLETHRVTVLGPVDHEFCHSIYFHDPNGIRLELTWDLRGFVEEDATIAAGAVEAWNRRTGRLAGSVR